MSWTRVLTVARRSAGSRRALGDQLFFRLRAEDRAGTGDLYRGFMAVDLFCLSRRHNKKRTVTLRLFICFFLL